jgi:hypothetical protein
LWIIRSVVKPGERGVAHVDCVRMQEFHLIAGYRWVARSGTRFRSTGPEHSFDGEAGI